MKTILLTGITGFIAKRIAVDLLNAGYYVRGSMRSTKRVQEVNAAIAPHLDKPESLTKLSFCELDLTKDKGWSDAVRGVDAMIHTASPFPASQPKDENELIRPAVDGTLAALKSAQAAGVTRVILTSSMVAIMHKDVTGTLTPDDWSTVGHPTMSTYAKSKTLAEKAAWDFVEQHPEMQLTTINPGLVLGTPTDKNFGTSLQLVSDMLYGKYPMIPNFGLPVVDIGDVAKAHVNALITDESIGKRFILADNYIMAPDMVTVMKAAHGDRKLPKRTAPKFLVRILALFDAQIKTVLPTIGITMDLDNSATTDILGITFTPWQEAVLASSKAIVAFEDT